MNRRIALLVVMAALVTAACAGGDRPPAGAEARTVDVEMVDIAFRPTKLAVAKGETVTFRFTNTGKVVHDASIGDPGMQRDREAEKARAGHAEESSLTLDPGRSGDLTYTFEEAGPVEIGCHQPGHYEAGMAIQVIVA